MPYTRETLAEQIHRLFDTPDLFRAWLDRHEKDEKVGVTCDAENCPLATFARDKGLPLFIEGSEISYQPTPKEDPDAYWPSGDWKYGWNCDAPEWVETFVEGIDNLGEDYTFSTFSNSPVTTRIAKHVLSTVTTS